MPRPAPGQAQERDHQARGGQGDRGGGKVGAASGHGRRRGDGGGAARGISSQDEPSAAAGEPRRARSAGVEAPRIARRRRGHRRGGGGGGARDGRRSGHRRVGAVAGGVFRLVSERRRRGAREGASRGAGAGTLAADAVARAPRAHVVLRRPRHREPSRGRRGRFAREADGRSVGGGGRRGRGVGDEGGGRGGGRRGSHRGRLRRRRVRGRERREAHVRHGRRAGEAARRSREPVREGFAGALLPRRARQGGRLVRRRRRRSRAARRAGRPGRGAQVRRVRRARRGGDGRARRVPSDDIKPRRERIAQAPVLALPVLARGDSRRRRRRPGGCESNARNPVRQRRQRGGGRAQRRGRVPGPVGRGRRVVSRAETRREGLERRREDSSHVGARDEIRGARLGG
mmetsp:Transcript_10036/g.41343  ORF Transcript_10036/g.41343 Transcript_10036/m.41343 type:complete len:401 (-) Transcript_10036:1874-3076(-)